ncbi:MAG: NADH-quinone oxidoreductase subunit NuoE [Thermodesulfovibrionales bacterium]|nr:NADH-quinone oxidoreductase subunit NuoE [Thermodesulfovibrionales bacterium]
MFITKLVEIFNEYKGEKGAVIPILQKVQDKLGYLSQEVISEIAKFSRMSETEVFGVASFYAQFRFTRCGDHVIRVCLGTACHVSGGERILDEVTRELGVSPGETTEDYKFSLERVACLGCCALAPVMVVDKTVYTKMKLPKVRGVLQTYGENK